jgi:predicted Zn-dependent protease
MLRYKNSQNSINDDMSPPANCGKSKRDFESKKLVFLSKKVLEEVQNLKETTGTQIALRIEEIYKEKKMKIDFKNVQRRVYDALNVLSALKIIRKDKNRICWIGIFKGEENYNLLLKNKQSENQNHLENPEIH